MIEIIEKAVAEQIKAKQLLTISEVEYDDERTFEVVMTDETNDRHGEILKADGLDYSNFMKNPVLIADHKYDIDHIIGKVTSIEYQENLRRWIARGVFSKSNPRAVLAKDLYNEGMLKAVSVGLIPQYYESMDTIKYWELLELTFCAVPANPNALSTEKKELVTKGIEFGLIVEKTEGVVIEGGEAVKEAETLILNEILDTVKGLQNQITELKTTLDTYKTATSEKGESEEVQLMKQIAGKSARLLQIQNQK